MFFSFIDVLGTCLFMPLGPILCQQAKGGPIDSYTELLQVPPSMLDYDELGLPDIFREAHAYLWPDGNPSPLGATMTLDQLREYAIEKLGNPRSFSSVPFLIILKNLK